MTDSGAVDLAYELLRICATMGTRTEKLEDDNLKGLLEWESEEPTIPFGDWLVRRGVINRRQLFKALNLSFRMKYRVGDALVDLGVLSRGEVENEATLHGTFRAFSGTL